mgnify:CR=1 FL=1
MSLCQKNMFRWQKTLTWVDSFTSVPNSFKLAVCVYIYNTVLSVCNSFVVVSLAKWNYFNAMIVMIMMMVVHQLNLDLNIFKQIWEIIDVAML